MNNFNTAYAIFCGLHFTPITRLKLTWDKLGKKYAHRLRKLDKLFGLQANYKVSECVYMFDYPIAAFIKTLAPFERG